MQHDKKKYIKGIYIEKEEFNLILFAGAMMVYVENSKEQTNSLQKAKISTTQEPKNQQKFTAKK